MQTRSIHSHLLRFVATLTLFLPLAAATSRAQTVINSLPYTINTPGDYVLGGNLTYNNPGGGNTEAAITFNVGNCTLDFAGHYISGLGAGKNTLAFGILARDRANITIQNGTIVGFYAGIYVLGSAPGQSGANNTGNVIQNMRLPSNTVYGIYLAYPTTCRVEGCQINKTGGSTRGSNGDSYAYGIYAVAGSVTLKNNQISTSTATGSGVSYGILCNNSANHFLRGNDVDTANFGIVMDPNGGKRQDNLTTSCNTSFSGGVDAGGNN